MSEVPVPDAPVNVFGAGADVTAVVYQLLATFPLGTLAVEGPVSRITVELPPGGTATVDIDVSDALFGGPDGERQRADLAGFLRSRLSGPDLDEAVARAGRAEVAVAIQVRPGAAPDPDLDEAVVETAVLVAGWLDGFALSVGHGALWGPDGELWATVPVAPDAEEGPAERSPAPVAEADGEPEPESDGDRLGTPSLVDLAAAAGDLGDGVAIVELPDHLDLPEPAPEPPPLSRVVARMLVLVAVSARCLTEEDGRHLAEARDGINAWCDELGIAGEVEEHEQAVLAGEPGTIDRKALVDGSWGAEAAAVLASSLGLIDLPPADVLVEPQAIYQAIGFPSSADTISVLGSARLLPAEELAAQQLRLRSVHWRLRELGLRPGPIDFAEVAGTSWFPLDVAGLELVGGDLGVGGVPVAEAEPDAVRLTTSIALERHRAAAWLVEGGRYSDTELST